MNDLGTIRPCRDLVTRVNYRTTYVHRDLLPLQMMFAMLLDEQPDVVRTYDNVRVRNYLAGVVARALSGQDEMEPTSAHNLVGFANRAITLLSQVDAMTGDIDPIEVLAERYMSHVLDKVEAYRIIRSSIIDVNDTTVLNILDNLKTLVEDAVPQVRLWSYDLDSPVKSRTVLLRRGQLKDHPMEQLKHTLDQSIKLFRQGGGNKLSAAAAIVRQGGEKRRSRVSSRGATSGRTSHTRKGLSRSSRNRSRTAEGSSTSDGGVRTRLRSPFPIGMSDTEQDFTELPPTPGKFLNTPSTSGVRAASPPRDQKKNKSRRSPPPAAVPRWLADVDED